MGDPFTADHLPDGGSSRSERVVSGHSGRDWAAEIGNGSIRMKTEHVKTPATTEEVSARGVEEGVKRHKSQRSAPFVKENRGGLEKRLKKDL
jgi:hypothetical protein